MMETPLFSFCFILHVVLITSIQISGYTQKLSDTFSKIISPITVSDYQTGYEPEQFESMFVNRCSLEIEKHVKFELFNHLVPNGSFIEDPDGDRNTSNFLQNVPTKFIAHGWLTRGTDEMCQTIKNQYLKSGNVNIVIVHWDSLSMSLWYLCVAHSLKPIAAFYSSFLEQLIKSKELKPDEIHLIGHSLGAHLSGHVGKILKSKNMKVSRITGLDPAYPGFHEPFDFHRLSKEDADFVDVVHTSGGDLGIMNPIGHVDFYPNGGTHPMPGCEGFWLKTICSHSRSWEYFAESINHSFLSRKCDTLMEVRSANCSTHDLIEMGDRKSKQAEGIYYFRTKSHFPYNLGPNGTYMDKVSSVDENHPTELFNCRYPCDVTIV